MNFFRSLAAFCLGMVLFGWLAYGAQAPAPVSQGPEAAALEYARLAILDDPGVYGRISLLRGSELRQAFESRHLQRGAEERKRRSDAADFSGLAALVARSEDGRAEVLVSGRIVIVLQDGRHMSEEGKMMVRLVRENGQWKAM